ncbi:MAG: phosphate-starvation-inducible PsiE family protein [Candidatus Scalindua sp.]|nr:phosphate-starvation-inducible PsiE family protein [Candidatus Scalindua sp.]MCR4343759.1 phosphate-starvation-inducible PsiE family protein [Candidatus Scalindua sp.]
MMKKLKTFERVIIITLISMMMLVIFIATVRLGWWLVVQLIEPPFLMFNIDQLFVIFGFFLMVLIGIELLESLKVYLSEDKIQVEVIFSIALIAVAKKIITLEISTLPSHTLIGIAAIVVSLSVGYILIKKAHTMDKPK